jgi:carbohydrate kinase (thermoresistant glucokinase family)
MKAIEERGANAVLACSALRQVYRDRISRAGNVRYVHLAGDHDTIAARLAARKNHYMPPTLLASQLRRWKRRPMRSSSTCATPFRCRSRRSVPP